MTIIRRAYRGETIDFAFKFAPANPPEADLYIVYEVSGTPTGENIPLTHNTETDKWEGEWQSDEADLGTVEWSARSSGTTSVAIEEGSFKLIGNAANQVPAEP